MLKYQQSGNPEGQMMIFINGGGVGPWMWQYQMTAFSRYNIITFDLPGHGANADTPFVSIDNCAKDIEQMIRKESNNGKAIIVGHSIGAQITLNMIGQYTQLVERAVVVSALNDPKPWMTGMLSPMIACTMPLIRQRWFSKLQMKELAIPSSWFEDYYQDSTKMKKENLVNVLKSNMNFSFGDHQDIETPVLVLTGQKEKQLMMRSAKKTVQNLTNAKGFIFCNAAHGIPYEQPDVFNQLVNRWIEQDSVSDVKGLISL